MEPMINEEQRQIELTIHRKNEWTKNKEELSKLKWQQKKWLTGFLRQNQRLSQQEEQEDRVGKLAKKEKNNKRINPEYSTPE